MDWEIKKFAELTTDELYEILKIRTEVFIVEQHCAYQDIDSKDKESYHLFLKEQESITAYMRILPRGISYKELSFGRVLVKENHRKKGLAKEMVQKAITFITEHLNEKEIRISAQSYLQKFYETFGFRQVSDIYLEDGIKHMEMFYQKNTTS